MNNKLDQIREQRKEVLQRVSENIKNNKSDLCENINDVLNVISVDETNIKKYEAIVKAKEIIADLIEQIVNCKTPEEISKVRNRINYYINKIKTELKNRNFTEEQINSYSEKVSNVRGEIAKYIRCLKRENNLKELEKLSKYKKLNSEQKDRMKKLLKNEKSFNRRYLNNSEVKKLSIQDAEKIVRKRWDKVEYLKPAICDYLFINSANVDEMNEKLIELAQMSESKFNKFVSENSEIQENIRKRKENSKTKTELKLPDVSMFLKKKDVQLEKISTEYIEQSSEMTIDKAATILSERCSKIEYLKSALEHWFITNGFTDDKIDNIIIDLANLSEKNFNDFVNSNYEIQKRINEEKLTKRIWELPEEETNAFYAWLFRKGSNIETSDEDMNKVLMMSNTEFTAFIRSLMNPEQSNVKNNNNIILNFDGEEAPYMPEVSELKIDGDLTSIYDDSEDLYLSKTSINNADESTDLKLKIDKVNSVTGIMLCESEDLIETLNEKVTKHKKQYKILNTYKYGNSVIKNIKFFFQNIPVYLVNKCRIDNMEVAYSRYYHGVDLGGYIRYSKKRNSILYGLRSALSKSYLNSKENQYLNNHEKCANWLIEYCKSIEGNSILNQYKLAK